MKYAALIARFPLAGADDHVVSEALYRRACPESRNTAFQALPRAGILPADVDSSRLEARWPHRQDACVPFSTDFPDTLSATRMATGSNSIVTGRP